MFTARSPGVARWAGTAAGVYCLLYAVAGAVIGMAAKVLLPTLESRDDAFAQFVEMQLPPLLAGLVLAAALAAVMSTSSGALIATATVFSQDIVAPLQGRDIEAGNEHDHIRSNRLYVAGFGIVMVLIACALQDVVAALTVAYDIDRFRRHLRGRGDLLRPGIRTGSVRGRQFAQQAHCTGGDGGVGPTQPR